MSGFLLSSDICPTVRSQPLIGMVIAYESFEVSRFRAAARLHRYVRDEGRGLDRLFDAINMALRQKMWYAALGWLDNLPTIS